MQFFKLVAFVSAIVMSAAATALPETGAMMKRDCTDLWALLNNVDIQPAVCMCAYIDPYRIYLIPMTLASQGRVRVFPISPDPAYDPVLSVRRPVSWKSLWIGTCEWVSKLDLSPNSYHSLGVSAMLNEGNSRFHDEPNFNQCANVSNSLAFMDNTQRDLVMIDRIGLESWPNP
ncbi:hypothetical protein DFH09DRAFT_1104775 [Mycena vulgaris]|nr:hypothetical protein DFH09DRAFT_1104775 [Mycena vulgaris]